MIILMSIKKQQQTPIGRTIVINVQTNIFLCILVSTHGPIIFMVLSFI